MLSRARLAPLFLAAALAGCSSGSSPSTPASGAAPATPPASGDGASAVLYDAAGALEATDARGNYSHFDRVQVPVRAGDRIRVSVTSTVFDTVLEVTPPRGVPLTNDDFQGDRTRSQLEFVTPVEGELAIQVSSFRRDALGAYHLKVERVPTPQATQAVAEILPERRHHVLGGLLGALAATVSDATGADRGAPAAAPGPLRLALGQDTAGSLAESDARLASGEIADVYVLDVTSPSDLTIEMTSGAIDSYLLVHGPDGRTWENDDAGGTRDAAIAIPAAPAGQYRVVATTFRAGVTGEYRLKASGSRDATLSASVAAAAPQSIPGTLAQGDRQLSSGEFVDEYTFEWPVGTSVRLEARSTAFDSYLILRHPSGHQEDNDDQAPGVLNAGMSFVVQQPGPHRVLVTSYAPGETGAYELVVTGGTTSGAVFGGVATPTPPQVTAPSTTTTPSAPSAGEARVIEGTLAAGDSTLPSGEFHDTHTVSFPVGQPVSVRLESSAFDPYVIVRPPEGPQIDNDDYRPGALTAGVDLPAAVAGDYTILTTSYRAGESGAYRLILGDGRAVAAATPSLPTMPGAQPGNGQSGRVWLLSVGISDYPGTNNDLPECANDAVKIAEALRNQGLTAPEREFLLTDSQATVAGIRTAMQRIAQQIQPSDTFVFFYSGHGGQTGGGSGDAREIDGRDEYLVAYDGQLMDDELGQLSDAIRGQTSLIAIDACFAGGFGKDVITRPGVVGLFSSEEDVTSAVAGQFQAGGYLSHFLRLAIQGEADNEPRDGVMTVGELTHFVWLQYGRHASAIRMEMGYQHLVVDRGAVSTNQQLWAMSR